MSIYFHKVANGKTSYNHIYIPLLVLQVTHMHGKFLCKSVMHVTLEQIIHSQRHV
jgi:uncharacterized membrane protein